MRIVVWNCNMALHKKLDALARIAPDVVVLPEARETSRLPKRMALAATRTYEWIGGISYKGLGVMAFAPFELEPACPPERNLEWVLPLRVRGPVNLTLLAVWAMNHRASPQAKGPNRDRQVAGALETYAHLFDEGPVVVAGDLNDSSIWDKPNGTRPFATKVDLLRERGLVSAYHEVLGVRFGEESDPTIYWRDRKADGPRYHIDYCFLPESWIPHTSVTVGSFDEWIAPKYSDHVPLIVDVELPS
jgi:exodeoxyribonuclease III